MNEAYTVSKIFTEFGGKFSPSFPPNCLLPELRCSRKSFHLENENPSLFAPHVGWSRAMLTLVDRKTYILYNGDCCGRSYNAAHATRRTARRRLSLPFGKCPMRPCTSATAHPRHRHLLDSTRVTSAIMTRSTIRKTTVI